MLKSDNLGDWCKWLERNFSCDIMIPTLPVIVRLDGRNFHRWAKNLTKPFDGNLSNLMAETTKHLVKETNALIGYTQSDEITLLLYSRHRQHGLYFGGRKQKIISILAAECASFFNTKRLEYLPDHKIHNAVFDCRVYQTPTLKDACAQLLWRELDATRNSIFSLAHSLLNHSELHKLNCKEMQNKMFKEKGVIWNNMETRFKRGMYFKKVLKSFTIDETAHLPEKHNALTKKSNVYTRLQIENVEYPPLNRMENFDRVLLDGETPIMSVVGKLEDVDTSLNICLKNL